MRNKAAFKYQLYDMRKALIIYYTIIYATLTVMIISDVSLKNHGIQGMIGGIEISSIIFLFIAGLNSFKNTFHFFLVNSVSRLTLFKTYSLSIFTTAGFMALIDTINGYIFPFFSRYHSLFYQLYSKKYEVYGSLAQVHGRPLYLLECFLWSLFIYALAGMIGYFITVLYYRMNKLQKIAVSVGIPILYIIVIPYIDYTLFNGLIAKGAQNFFSRAFGFLNGFNPYISMLSSAIGFVVSAGLSYLLICKATIKE